MPQPLEELPNIGEVLAERLRASGIASAEQLLEVGDYAAFERLRGSLPEDACVHTRLALAGAVRGIRHLELPADVKAQIRSELA